MRNRSSKKPTEKPHDVTGNGRSSVITAYNGTSGEWSNGCRHAAEAVTGGNIFTTDSINRQTITTVNVHCTIYDAFIENVIVTMQSFGGTVLTELE
jgi:hypothetical protein